LWGLGGSLGGAPSDLQENSMFGDKVVIQHLNKQLKNELTAINLYFLHARMLNHWGFNKLGKHEYDESIGEMKHADMLIERIFMLDGLPNLQDMHKIMIGENVPELLGCDLKLEQAARQTVVEAIEYCESTRDYVSRDLFLKILDDTEEHIDWLGTQLELIEKVGLQNYLQSQMGDHE
jgi:bacterioferritin